MGSREREGGRRELNQSDRREEEEEEEEEEERGESLSRAKERRDKERRTDRQKRENHLGLICERPDIRFRMLDCYKWLLQLDYIRKLPSEQVTRGSSSVSLPWRPHPPPLTFHSQ